MNENAVIVPNGLRTWFVIHFVADVLVGIPLLFFPHTILTLVGWTSYDPVMPRLVGAALIGIGVESLLSRKATADTFRAILNLKVIWASSALFAIGAGLTEGAPSVAWAFLGIFFLFWCVWVYYRLVLR